MKVLKKLISINLIVFMLFGLIKPAAAAELSAIGTGTIEQTNAAEFSEDSEAIPDGDVVSEGNVGLLAGLSTNYPEAVNVLAKTGILMDEFVADQPLTRAKAVQVVSRMILGPTTANELKVTTALFSDVPAEDPYAGYIAFCLKEGIVSGYADGTFKPNNELTGYAFFKILLGTLGYDAVTEGYVGANWSVNVAKRVSALGLTSGLKGVFNGNAAPTQEEACLYVLNTLKADTGDYEGPKDTPKADNYQEAVDVLAATGLLMDGFVSDQPLTRAEAAQVISRLILGPITANKLKVTAALFSDVPANDPYAGYIAFCQEVGIISGYADGTFKPNSRLTGYAFFKLLLGVLGYDAQTEGYVGANWSINVAKRAFAVGLASGLKDDFNGTAALTQEEACLYVLNTLKARPVRYTGKTAVQVGGATVALSGMLEEDPNYSSYADKLFGSGDGALTWSCRKNENGIDETTYVFAGQTIGTYLADPGLDKILTEARQAGLLEYFQSEEWDAGYSMSRLDMAKLCAGFLEAEGVVDPDDYSPEDIPFTDAASLTDIEKQLLLAVSGAGIINGYADGAFRPDVTLTRAAVAKVLCNLLLGSATAADLTADKKPFEDVAEDHVLAGYIAYCKEENIIYGDEYDCFDPDSYAEEITVLEWFLRMQPQKVRVTLDSNGGTVEGAAVYTFDCVQLAGYMALPSPDQRLGRNFISWNTVKDGSGENYEAGRTSWAGTTDELTLYAQWEESESACLVTEDEVCIFAPSLPESDHLLLAVYDENGKMRGMAFAREDADQVLHFEVRNVTDDMGMNLIFMNEQYFPCSSVIDGWSMGDPSKNE